MMFLSAQKIQGILKQTILLDIYGGRSRSTTIQVQLQYFGPELINTNKWRLLGCKL